MAARLAAVPDLHDLSIGDPEHLDAAVLVRLAVGLCASSVPVDRHHRPIVVQDHAVEVEFGAQVECVLKPLDGLGHGERLHLAGLVAPGRVGDQLGDEVEAPLVVEDVEVPGHDSSGIRGAHPGHATGQPGAVRTRRDDGRYCQSVPLPGFEALGRRLYTFAFLDWVGPLYAVYTLWFNDNGATTAEISGLFLFWAIVAIVLEVPSGAFADMVDRRVVVALALGLRAIGVVVWLLWPALPGLFVGAFLWAAHDALASGAWQALVAR